MPASASSSRRLGEAEARIISFCWNMIVSPQLYEYSDGKVWMRSMPSRCEKLRFPFIWFWRLFRARRKSVRIHGFSRLKSMISLKIAIRRVRCNSENGCFRHFRSLALHSYVFSNGLQSVFRRQPGKALYHSRGFGASRNQTGIGLFWAAATDLQRFSGLRRGCGKDVRLSREIRMCPALLTEGIFMKRWRNRRFAYHHDQKLYGNNLDRHVS